MRLKVQYATREHIIGTDAVEEFIYACIFNLKLGIGFHPDTDFEDYIFKQGEKEGKKAFTKQEAEELNKTLAECFEQCKKEGADIYRIALKKANPLLQKVGKK